MSQYAPNGLRLMAKGYRGSIRMGYDPGALGGPHGDWEAPGIQVC